VEAREISAEKCESWRWRYARYRPFGAEVEV
jgi:hypothetical protein